MYQLQLPMQWKIHNAFHASLLTPYKQTQEYGENFPRQVPELVDRQEEWVVEKVLNSQRHGRGKRLQYLLSWAGYPEADNSWEYKENIFSPELIKEFHQKHPTAVKFLIIQSMTTTPTPTSPTSRPTSPATSDRQTEAPALPNWDRVAFASGCNW